ncbi:hypothetical protein [Paenibacillus sp. HB172176]|uniref:hypothetical protein n=1 Tax=Paenibacillus sp. HB172176 TaxID=2493690 RepID=UPI0014389387|nr:hypothetical protein [Paenibacillus sp. HB172176]
MTEFNAKSQSNPLQDRSHRIKEKLSGETIAEKEGAARNANDEWKQWYAIISETTKKLRG